MIFKKIDIFIFKQLSHLLVLAIKHALKIALRNIGTNHVFRSARGLDWYTGYQHKFMSINSIRRYSSTWCRREKSWSRHQNCKRIGLVHRVSA